MDYTQYSLPVLSLKIKTPTTFDEQVRLLENRGLYFTDKEEVIQLLKTTSYYHVSGYLHNFKKDNNLYREDINFKRLKNIINFDIELRNLCLSVIDIIERSLKTKIAYHFAHNYMYGNIAYIYPDQFEAKHAKTHEKLIKYINKSISDNKHLPYIMHHFEKYEGYLPIWVAIELFTIGNLKFFYSILNNPTKKLIADEFGYKYEKIENWLECLRVFRNMLAHNLRLYNTSLRFQTSITALYTKNTNRIFDYILMMKYLVLDNSKWTDFIDKLTALLEKYRQFVNLDSIGFPEEWQEIFNSDQIKDKLKKQSPSLNQPI